MVSYVSAADRQNNGRSGAGNGHGKVERTPGTPRKDGRVVKEKAVQVPELRDYVCFLHLRSGSQLLIQWPGPGRLLRERGFWVSL
jgi:hypothetical protein